MKKQLILLAALGAANAWSADGQVTLFGNVDVAAGHYSGSESVSKMTSSSLTASMFGLRGTEDLGDGLKAGIWLEAGVDPDAGTGLASNSNNQASGAGKSEGLSFNRRATVGLSGALGEVRLGRDYAPDYWSKSTFDPFGALGVARSTTMSNVGTSAANIRVSNSVHYLYGITPNAHANGLSARGFYLQATAGMGENTGSTASIGKSDGDYRGMRLGWQGGALHVAAAYAETKNQLQSDYRVGNIGASYRVGSVQLTSLYNRNKTGNNAIDNRTILLGARIFVPTGTVRISYNHYKSSSLLTAGQKAQQLGLGYEHLLSKRTSIYGNFAYLKNSAGANFSVLGAPVASVNGSSRGLELGLRHAF